MRFDVISEIEVFETDSTGPLVTIRLDRLTKWHQQLNALGRLVISEVSEPSPELMEALKEMIQ